MACLQKYPGKDLVRWNEPYYYLQGILHLQERYVKVELGYELSKKRKVIKINGKTTGQFRLAQYCPVVFFIPEDLELIRRGPEERRRYLDRELSQESTLYAELISRYNRVIYQKNRILKERKRYNEIIEMLRPWNKQVVYLGSRIIHKRARAISAWNKLAAKTTKYSFKMIKR